MQTDLDITFEKLSAPRDGTAVLLSENGDEHKELWGKVAGTLNKSCDSQLGRAAAVADFSGKAKQTLEIVAPAGRSGLERVLVVGLGTATDYSEPDWLALGGRIWAELKKRKLKAASLILETQTGAIDPLCAARLAAGMHLRAYRFDVHKTRRDDANGDAAASDTGEATAANDNGHNKSGGKAAATDADARKASVVDIRIACGAPSEAEAHFAVEKALADGVCVARDLVNEPANILGPVEFAERIEAMTDLGLEVTILGPQELADIGMGSLLCVSRGSEREPRVAIMHWYGANSKRSRPVCFVGKGVVFDTGGISLKPPKGMEDMKGDMGGAAAVVGVMHALAARNAAVNAVGIVGLVENMPSGTATRPGDIVTSLSGQTVEVINTDAEGRLVLSDLLWHAEETFKPRFMIDLATLTGAIIVALGKEYAGLFSNDDRLAQRLMQAGEATGDKCWRLPMGDAYDKALRSKFADMKNVGGPSGGSITAAQFLKRYVRDVPWAHIDLAGTAMASPSTDINESWGSGYGVRLLNALVAQHYEASRD